AWMKSLHLKRLTSFLLSSTFHWWPSCWRSGATCSAVRRGVFPSQGTQCRSASSGCIVLSPPSELPLVPHDSKLQTRPEVGACYPNATFHHGESDANHRCIRGDLRRPTAHPLRQARLRPAQLDTSRRRDGATGIAGRVTPAA